MDFNAFLSTLPIMVQGIIGIFFVTGIIMLFIFFLNKISGLWSKK